MKAWHEFAAQAPQLADAALRLLYQGQDTASAFLATVAPDGGPRVHPIFPVLDAGELWMFVVQMSPKYKDLLRQQRFALHSFPTREGGEELHLRGGAVEITDAAVRQRVVDATQGRQGHADFERLFRCELSSVLHTRWDHWGTARAWPSYAKWLA